MEKRTNDMIGKRYGLLGDKRIQTVMMDGDHQVRDLKTRIRLSGKYTYGTKFDKWARDNEHHFPSIATDPIFNINNADESEIEEALKYWVQFELAYGTTQGHENFRLKLLKMTNLGVHYFTEINYNGLRRPGLAAVSSIDVLDESTHQGITPAEILSQINAGLFDEGSMLMQNLEQKILNRLGKMRRIEEERDELEMRRKELEKSRGEELKRSRGDKFERGSIRIDRFGSPKIDGRFGHYRGLLKKKTLSRLNNPIKGKPQKQWKTQVNKLKKEEAERAAFEKEKREFEARKRKVEEYWYQSDGVSPDRTTENLPMSVNGGKRKSTRKRKSKSTRKRKSKSIRKRKRKPTRKRKSTRKR